MAAIPSSALPPELAEQRDQIRKYAEDFGLDFFETIFEMVDSDQINSLAAYGGFPVRYPHWRFGMDYDQLSKGYEWGMQKIYEMVINTDPSYAYLVRGNSLVEQKLVMAHVYGHVDFFKNNYWFSKTNRKMLDAMANHAVRIREYMDRYGQDVVEDFIDCCLSLENLIDPHLPFRESSQEEERKDESLSEREKLSEVGKLKSHRSYMDSYINPKEFIEHQTQERSKNIKQEQKFPSEPEKDILGFLLQHAPLEPWQQEVLNIIRNEAYYYVPQMQTKIMNEGWASYWHSRIMTEKALRDSEVIDFAMSHSGTTATSPGQMNPYKVGIELFRDIEDRWNKGKFGKEYEECDDIVKKERWDTGLGKGREKIFEVRRVCNDITFIDQYLTPEFVERFDLYTYEFNRRTNQYEIVDRDFDRVKEKMLGMLTNAGQPFIYLTDGNYKNRGELLLWHKHQGVDLDIQYARETMRALSVMWNRPVHLETLVENQKKIYTYSGGEFEEQSL